LVPDPSRDGEVFPRQQARGGAVCAAVLLTGGAMSAAGEMNFELPDELRMLKEAVRRFVDAEMIPVEMRSRVGDGMDPQIKADLVEKAKVLGLAGFDVPEQYGGQGFGLLAKAVVWAELGRTIALPPRAVEIFGPIISPLLYLMNDAQKA